MAGPLTMTMTNKLVSIKFHFTSLNFDLDFFSILNKKDGIKSRNITLPLVIPNESEYCITGLYNQDTFLLIIPTLLEIMFYETENYSDEEIFFNFTKKDSDISIVLETKLLKK
jgi:hypothetical protein